MIGNPTNHASHVQNLYEGIAEGKYENDQEASMSIYGEGENSQIYFTRLKRQLYKRLINSLFFIDVNQPSFNDYQKAYYSCHKNYAAVKILIGRNARRSAIQLAEQTLKKALKFEFTDLIINLAKDLRLHYGTVTGERKPYQEYKDLIKKYQEIFLAELQVEELYTDLAINFVNSRATKIEVETLAENYVEDLELLIKKYSSYRLNLYAYLGISLRYQISNDHQNTLRVCEEAIRFFKTKEHIASKGAIVNFLFKMLACYIPLKEHTKGQEVAEKCLQLVGKGSSPWFNILNHLTILLFHTRQFQKAYEVFQRAYSHPKFKNLYKSQSEDWRINEAFIHYFILIGKIDLTQYPEEMRVKKFRVSKFLNEVPIFSKDKRGNNITILIIQMLFLLQKGQYDKVIDRMEAINAYCNRYLRNDDTYRSNCFIKMLLQLPKAHFNKTAAIRKADKFVQKLKKVPLEQANQSNELEIVPYEMLWEFVLESLDNRFHYH
jgi:hypothetical protein